MAKSNQVVVTSLAILIFSFCNCSYSQSVNQSVAGVNQIAVPATTKPHIVGSDANQRTWQWQSYEVTPDGQIRTHVHQVHEVATGLNHLVGGRYIESSDEIIALPQGGAAAKMRNNKCIFRATFIRARFACLRMMASFCGRFGPTIEVTAPDGRGIVYDANGKFLFFKE